MAEAYVGEIRIFAGNFPPMGWALCNGQLMNIQQNAALFSVIGVQYGGDGKTTFALPNLMGAAPMNQGQGPGLTSRQVGKAVGAQNVTLLESQMPAHNHIPMAIQAQGSAGNPADCFWSEAVPSGRPPKQPPLYDNNINVGMSSLALGATGGNQSHNNMQPYLVLTYIICLQGEFPSKG